MYVALVEHTSTVQATYVGAMLLMWRIWSPAGKLYSTTIKDVSLQPVVSTSATGATINVCDNVRVRGNVNDVCMGYKGLGKGVDSSG